jgi:hypothetical protein
MGMISTYWTRFIKIEHSIEPLGDQIISQAFIVIGQQDKWEHRPEGLVGNGCEFWVEAYP